MLIVLKALPGNSSLHTFYRWCQYLYLHPRSLSTIQLYIVLYTTTLSLICLKTQLIFLCKLAPSLFSISVMVPPNSESFLILHFLSHYTSNYSSSLASFTSKIPTFSQFHFTSTAMSPSPSQHHPVTFS